MPCCPSSQPEQRRAVTAFASSARGNVALPTTPAAPGYTGLSPWVAHAYMCPVNESEVLATLTIMQDYVEWSFSVLFNYVCSYRASLRSLSVTVYVYVKRRVQLVRQSVSIAYPHWHRLSGWY